jgi:hypothetical protein
MTIESTNLLATDYTPARLRHSGGDLHRYELINYPTKKINMKKAIDQFLALGVILFLSCDNNKSDKVPAQQNSIANEATSSSEDMPPQSESIIGSWNLVMQAFDDNGNGKLDDAERKKGSGGRHFYQFKTDGTCLIHTLKLKGYYELKDEGGKKRLYTYIDDEGKKTPENKWYVISVTKTEMILLSQDKYAFWIYKRV